MKTAIIGAGNMGGSIARGLANGSLITESDIIESNPSANKLEQLKKEFPAIKTTHNFGILPEMPMYRVIPNTAICELESMTLVSARNTNSEQDEFILSLFREMGMAMIIPEEKMGAATALASCGIAYVLKYIQASMQAGIEMGLSPENAMAMIAQSAKGAAALILKHQSHPSIEIDKVTTPGGITIRGLNELEHNGFSSAVIKAMKAALS